MPDSIMAPIRRGDGDGDQFAVRSGQFRCSEHQFAIQRKVRAQHGGMNTVRLQDVRNLTATGFHGLIGAPQFVAGAIFTDHSYPGHLFSSTQANQNAGFPDQCTSGWGKN